MTKIELIRASDTFHLEALNESGNTIHMDASPDIGGTNNCMGLIPLFVPPISGDASMWMVLPLSLTASKWKVSLARLSSIFVISLYQDKLNLVLPMSQC